MFCSTAGVGAGLLNMASLSLGLPEVPPNSSCNLHGKMIPGVSTFTLEMANGSKRKARTLKVMDNLQETRKGPKRQASQLEGWGACCNGLGLAGIFQISVDYCGQPAGRGFAFTRTSQSYLSSMRYRPAEPLASASAFAFCV